MYISSYILYTYILTKDEKRYTKFLANIKKYIDYIRLYRYNNNYVSVQDYIQNII